MICQGHSGKKKTENVMLKKNSGTCISEWGKLC